MNELQIATQFIGDKLEEILDIPVFNGIQEDQENLNTYCVYFIDSIEPVRYAGNTTAWNECTVIVNLWNKTQYLYTYMEQLTNHLDGQQGAVVYHGADIGYVNSCVFQRQELLTPAENENYYGIQATYQLRVTNPNGLLPRPNSYNSLADKPQINGVTLENNKTGADYGLADLTVTDALEETKADKTELPENLSDLTNDAGFIAESVINNKDLETLASAKSYADTKDTATLNSAKAYTDSAVGGETLELIAEGSVTEAVSSFDISQDKLGNAFNLKEFYIKIDNFANPSSTSSSHSSGGLYIHNTNTGGRLMAMTMYWDANTTTNRQYNLYFKKLNGYWVLLSGSTNYDNGNGITGYNGCAALDVNCDRIYFAFFSQKYTFNYKLFGVRV